MKKLFLFIVMIIILLFSSFFGIINVSAHNTLLAVDYDQCGPEGSDDERWYYLCEKGYSQETNYNYYHLDHNIKTIKYYISNTSIDNADYSWNTEVTSIQAEEVKNAFINSLLEWNNKYYYTYDQDGNRIANRIINIEEGTESDHNLIIYPMEYSCKPNTIATTIEIDPSIDIPTGITNIKHTHYTNWIMKVNVRYFIYGGVFGITDNEVDLIQDWAGEHEMGHVLGLDDIDVCCNREKGRHHEEVIMGYGVLINRTPNATYKDIAGVSIIRGLHTDNDHVWMKRSNNGITDLICAQCNGVLYNVSLDSNGQTYNGQTLNEYKNCLHYNGTESNMLLVATDGIRDYFKCQNCRHIDTVEINEEYTLSNYSSTINKNITLGDTETKYYKITSNYSKYYEFIMGMNSNVNIKLYDDNFNEVNINYLENNNLNKHFIQNMQTGTYYLALINKTSSSAIISLKIQSRNTAYLGVGDNDILLNTYNNNNVYNFINNTGAGFYKFSIETTTKDGTTITYPYEALKIYDHLNEEIELKYNVKGYAQTAKTEYNTNYLYMYLERNGYYYIHVDIPDMEYSSVKINIKRVEFENIDVASRYDQAFTEVLVNSNDMAEYAMGFSINQTSVFTLSATTREDSNSNITLILFRKEFNKATQTYYRTDIIGSYLSITNERLILEEGIYFIGFFGNTDNVPISILINRIVTTSEITDQVLMMDPNETLSYGTEVRHNNGAFGGLTITEGFTRHVHFKNVTGVPSVSRYDYTFYSSNLGYATVSEFGTVLAKAVNQDREVKVTAV